MGRGGTGHPGPAAINHFFSEIDALERSPKGAFPLDPRDREFLGRDFSQLLAPVIGGPPAEDLFYRTLDRVSREEGGSLQKLGYKAAFFLGEYDDASMTLDAEDWQEIKETIEDASEEINLVALTSLMDGLLSRGLLK
jgi:hypothetical protein